MRPLVLAFLAAWTGLTLVLGRVPWFSRRPLTDRLGPYVPTAAPSAPQLWLSVQSVRDIVAPLSQAVGNAASRGLGISEDLAVRLRRIHSSISPAEFRVQQLGWAVIAMAGGATLALASQAPLLVTGLLLLGAPALAFLIAEQRLATASAAWQRRLFLELPVVSEQLAMLLGAGYSLSAALTRLAARGQGCAARDLTRVCQRIRQGLSETAALREWAELAGVPAVSRLVPILAFNRETSDLARLVSDEARATRRDVHRELLETMERRGQQVWIPVTVATLIPGAIFLAIPFIEALQLFAGT